MSMEIVYTEKSAPAVGPYSQAIATGDFVFASGQTGLDPKSGEVVSGTVREQAMQVMENLKEVLLAASSSFDRVVKTTCFLTDMADFSVFNEVYAAYFGDHRPARSCVAVKALPKNALVEVEAIALRK